jgi:hypothetical protein
MFYNSLYKLNHNGLQLQEVGDFHHPPRRIDAENQTLINHKCVCEALNRHFCQARVSGSCFSFRPSHWFIVLIVCSYRNVVLFGLLKNTFHSRSLKGQTGIRLSLLLTDLVSRKPLYSE